ncbi:hypothetical protein [Erinnyis ello granulovirus]|uniref:Uncharacterized protein n=1 Tax=Erinnyis ello granulovirus TaxID=307444 RepID=A0A097DAS5_9BBAC|nr:hypothetical protein [Erinnyis ello granulovirus]AIS92097.1 hypothetical protein [Erinnyis ello granulovirus]ARX71437.1 hypothetical protein EREL_098 [Erinnyis ello granulovirus]ARX71567.1 hypothetical protein EREL_098 [Erinnyis ello granulovirus]ARX71697.1 hypothetical protein EREL_098 [Erinnyis ello granulovirus]ARX71827.1 hypothetical protein EREL_098 [Erinnyis ello granulovirus]
MIKRSVIDISTINNGVAVEPIPLKLSHNQNNKQNDVKTDDEPITRLPMWMLVVSCVLIIMIVFLVSYFIINHVNGDYTGSDDEDYGELQYMEIGVD